MTKHFLDLSKTALSRSQSIGDPSESQFRWPLQIIGPRVRVMLTNNPIVSKSHLTMCSPIGGPVEPFSTSPIGTSKRVLPTNHLFDVRRPFAGRNPIGGPSESAPMRITLQTSAWNLPDQLWTQAEAPSRKDLVTRSCWQLCFLLLSRSFLILLFKIFLGMAEDGH